MLATIRPAGDLLATPIEQLTDADAADLLALARNRISDPDRWTKYEMARTVAGDCCDPLSPGAYSFCAAGAIRSLPCQPMVSARLHCELSREVVSGKDRRDGYRSGVIQWWNDSSATRHADILAGFDAAIARLRGDGPF